jgi:hypothetical protein
MELAFLIWRNRKSIWSDRATRAVLLILFAYLFVFGLVVGNFGTGIRHRAKFVAGLIVSAAPLLPKLIIFKKKKSHQKSSKSDLAANESNPAHIS